MKKIFRFVVILFVIMFLALTNLCSSDVFSVELTEDVNKNDCIRTQIAERQIFSNRHEDGEKRSVYEKHEKTLKTQCASHKEHLLKEKTIKQATCTEYGQSNLICEKCDAIIEIKKIDKKEHDIIEQVIEYPSCSKYGIIQDICQFCNAIISTRDIPVTSHNFVVISKTFATPYNEGVTKYTCDVCNRTKETIQERIWVKGLYIPSVDINVDINIGDCNQYNTDNYDVNCAYNLLGEKRPVIFGHNTGTLGKIYDIKKGDLIYLLQNETVVTYKVTVSDVGIDIDDSSNIQSVNTGQKCLFYNEQGALHMFTCYNDYRYGNCRWMVIAERI